MSNASSTLDAVHNSDNTRLGTVNGASGTQSPPITNGNSALNPASPAADSPATPVSNTVVPDVKIDYQEQESDVRHEPVPIKSIDSIDKIDNASTIPQIGSPADSSTIPIHPPSGTPRPPTGQLLDDVKMTEAPTHNVTSNGATDVVMSDAGDVQTPATTPGLLPPQSSVGSIDSNAASPANHPPSSDSPHDEEELKPPPAKRARMQTDLDKPSTLDSATPPPASSVVSNENTPVYKPVISAGPSTFTNAQWRFCMSTIRSLKKLKDAGPFLKPVDPIALNIPHYPSIIKYPMDFSTVERKLNSSNPQKPDPSPFNLRYMSAEEFISDVRLIFQNCLTFNGPEHAIVSMGKRVEEVFDKQIKQMPPGLESKAPATKKPTPPPPAPLPVAAPKKSQPARRVSTSVPVIRRSDTEPAVGRPKREIHPPPPKDLPYADVPKKRKGKPVRDDGTTEQLKFCSRVLTDLHRKQHYAIAHPFYEPVDYVKLDLPTYPKIVKKPMDLSTMRKKLDNHEYPNAQKFCDDFKLMIRNCFAFNPAGTPVNQAGIELQRLFDEKWKNLPPLRNASEDEDEDDEDDSDAERQRAIAEMESQIETMRDSIAALKAKPKKEKKKHKQEKAPVASTSKAPSKPAKTSSSKKSKGKKPIADDDVLTFEQKKDLSESISRLEGAKLEKVIQIIHEGVPEIRDSTEEIELEIDTLPAAVLTKLYNFVIRPMRQPTAKRNRTGKGTGTGGLKRKSMDEDVEAEKIRQLEERMALFNQNPNGPPPVVPRRADDSDHSSDSSSGSDSSGSDSE
ncbi:hypothetical protein AX16_005593 [Volvariella volvacea WC 439]|nr:hypothetical protein AX16_005593 [Volvariella volvacea WC 439]